MLRKLDGSCAFRNKLPILHQGNTDLRHTFGEFSVAEFFKTTHLMSGFRYAPR